MRKVCCFCETWESGGIESFLHNVLLHMDMTELQIDIVAVKLKDSVFTSALEARGIRFFELSGKLRSLENHRLFGDLLKKEKYDVVHFNLYQGLSLSYVQQAKNMGVPVRIAHSHNSALRKSRGRWLKLLLHNAGKFLWTGAATDLWACSGIAAKFLFGKKVLSEKGFTFIPNGIDVERFRFDPAQREAVRAELGLTDEFAVGNVGRLCYQKNQSFLLDVFAELLKQRPDSRLILVGDGEDREKLKEKAERLEISDKVIFYGVTNQIEQILWAMDVFAFPSRFEGFGIVAIEAQAAGLPVLCSEAVPAEARIIDKTYILPLEANLWKNKLINENCVHDRCFTNNIIKNAGFDVEIVKNKIQSVYRGTR